MNSLAEPQLNAAQILDLPLDSLQDSPFQVKRYDDARVRGLAETIRKQGLLQPATVRRVAEGYQLIAGHGRRAAVRYLRDKVATTEAEKSRWATLRCVLLEDVDDARAAALTAIENLQRDDAPSWSRRSWSPGRARPARTGAPQAFRSTPATSSPSSASGECRPTFETRPRLTTALGTALPSAAVSTHAERLLVPSPSPSLAEATRPTWSAARKPGVFFLGSS